MEPAADIRPVRHKPYARTRPSSPKAEPTQLSLVEAQPLKVSDKERERFAARLTALSKLKTEIGAALSARSERAAMGEPETPRAARA
jgi:hypothetical protein